MRAIAVFLSVVTLIYLTYSFIIGQKANKITEKALNSPKLVVPAYISDTPLMVEEIWQQLKAERIKAKQPVDKVDSSSLKNKDVLTIGKNKYVLYGIFNANKQNKSANVKENSKKMDVSLGQPFILIKSLVKKGNSEESIMLKVIQGDEISKGVTLTIVTSNSISFKKNDKLVEFKLFEVTK